MEMLTKNMKQLIQEVKNEMRRGRAKAFDFNTPISELERAQPLAVKTDLASILNLNHSPLKNEDDPGLDRGEFRRLLEKVGLGED
jgi:hypothetical protein